MSQKDFWSRAKIAVIGGGSWGTVLGQLASQNVAEVRLWVREEERARQINSTRSNPKYVSSLILNSRIKAYSELERVFEGGVQAVIWVLPSKVARVAAKNIAPFLTGEEILIHASKGIEPGTLKRISEILSEELPSPRIGVLSGPNLADEIARNEPAATVVASAFPEVIDAAQCFLSTQRFRVYGATDVIGVEWAGTLKNVLAIASGALDAMSFGWNTRGMLISRGLAEMVRFGLVMGADYDTFLGLAGVGDLLATCSSPLSRNYRVGFGIGQGKSIETILAEVQSTAEGVATATSVWDRNIYMPITEGVVHLVRDRAPVSEVLAGLMTRPPLSESPTSKTLK